MREQQIIPAEPVADLAYHDAQAWARQHGRREPTKTEFCGFFDLVTQNGNSKACGSSICGA
jgi:hypothetical protein